MSFSLLFPLTLLLLGGATLLVGNAPAPESGRAVQVAEVLSPPVNQPGPEPEAEPPVPGPEPEARLPEPAPEHAPATAHVFFMPVDGAAVAEVPSTFGDPRGADRLHEGIDIMAERGTPVRAAAPGIVRRVTESDRGGLSVTVVGHDGLRYFYTHFDSFPEGLAVGQEVGTDTVIGFVGNSGNAAATAPHLHFGVYRPLDDGPWSWEAFDPLPFLIDRSPAAP